MAIKCGNPRYQRVEIPRRKEVRSNKYPINGVVEVYSICVTYAPFSSQERWQSPKHVV